MAVLYVASEELTIDLNRTCFDQSINLGWLNDLAGWDYWVFTARKSYSYNMSEVETIKKDILQDWDTEFTDGQTEQEHISLSANESYLIRSQNLTIQQATAIARIKYAIKVQDVSDIDNPVTVLVDKSSIQYTTDKAKTNFIQFTITYPSIIVQNQ